jgi:ribosome-binding protein aMBF1 (putative translation factor)
MEEYGDKENKKFSNRHSQEEYGEQKRMVEAIEEGKIVKVSEDYAKREGLMILRRPEIDFKVDGSIASREDDERRLLMDDFRKPLDWKDNRVAKDLVENFHWHIARERRRKNTTRRDFAEALGESENTIKMLENGILPKNDFVLIKKVQDYLGINLRKDKQVFGQEMRELVESEQAKRVAKDVEVFDGSSEEIDNNVKEERKKDKISGDDIELIE